MHLRLAMVACLCAASTTFAQDNALQVQLKQFESALTKHKQVLDDNEAQLSLGRLSQKLQLESPGTPFAMQMKTLTFQTQPVGTDELVTGLQNIVAQLSTAEGIAWTGSGIAEVDISFEETTSPWSSDYVRNGFDKAKPFLEWVGTGLMGASLLLNANGNTGVTTSKRATSIGAVGALLIGSVLQKYLGAKQTNDAAGSVGKKQLALAQLLMSREAYNQIQARYGLAKKYHDSSQIQVDKLNDVLTQLAKFTDATKAKPQDLLPLVDQLSAINEAYSTDSKFVDNYLGEVIQLYDTYAKEYGADAPALAAKLSKASKDASDFQKDFQSKIVNGLLRNLPQVSSDLQRMRIQLQDQIKQGS